jgi:hypothetical protein
MPLIAMAAPPPLMLWAWERPTDLRGLPASAGIAYLVATLRLEGTEVRVVPRLQPLRADPGTYRMAVVRIEAAPSKFALSAAQRSRTAVAIVDALRVTRAESLQIDFDATASQRVFYAALIRDVRAKIGPKVFLSITALVSWCGAGSWLDRLPVDETVPMAFEMGPDAAAAETLFRSGGELGNARCRDSVGVSVDGPKIKLPRTYRRTYLFHYADWDKDFVRSVLSRFP